MVVHQGDICWAALRDPVGSEPGYRRPVLVIQGDRLNASALATVVCVPMTSNMRLAAAPGNVVVPSRTSGLPKDSVGNVSGIVALNKTDLEDPVGSATAEQLQLVFRGVDLVLGRT